MQLLINVNIETKNIYVLTNSIFHIKLHMFSVLTLTNIFKLVRVFVRGTYQFHYYVYFAFCQFYLTINSHSPCSQVHLIFHIRKLFNNCFGFISFHNVIMHSHICVKGTYRLYLSFAKCFFSWHLCVHFHLVFLVQFCAK